MQNCWQDPRLIELIIKSVKKQQNKLSASGQLLLQTKFALTWRKMKFLKQRNLDILNTPKKI